MVINRLKAKSCHSCEGGNPVFFIIPCILLLISLVGCGAEDSMEDQDTTPLVDPSWFTAMDFPTADGVSWEYVDSEKTYTHTTRVKGTQNLAGETVRILENNSDIPVDYTGVLYGFPVRKYMFTKDLDQYKEYAFELWVDVINDSYTEKYIPERVAWSFPLYEGKEWTVSRPYTEPVFIYTRKVVSANENVSVPAGNFSQVFVVEEYVLSDAQQNLGLVSTYWLAKGVGVIKYQYIDPTSARIIAFELNNFTGK